MWCVSCVRVPCVGAPISVTTSASPSSSVSLRRTLMAIGTPAFVVAVSSRAIGGRFAGFTVIATVVPADGVTPSLAAYTNESSPKNGAAGV